MNNEKDKNTNKTQCLTGKPVLTNNKQQYTIYTVNKINSKKEE